MDDSRLGLLAECYREAKRFREKDTKTVNPFTGNDLSNPWYYYDRMYRGFQWDLLSGMASWASRPVKNIVAMGVEGMTTMLTDNSPEVSIVPREPADVDLADVTRAAIEHWYETENAQAKVALAVKSSRIYSVGWFRTYYDKKKGRTCLGVVPTDSVWVDPDCTVEDYDPFYVIYESRMSLSEIKRLYPKPEKGYDYKDFDKGWTAVHAGDRSNTYDRYEDNKSNPSQTCAVYELWKKDGTATEWEQDLGDSVAKGKKQVYKNGLRKTVYAGGLVLKDGDSPYDHGEIPFTPVHAYPVPGRFYGFGDPQLLMPIQVMRNRMSQFIFDATVKSGNGFILVGQASGIDPNKVTNAPIQVLPCKDVTQFRIERSPAPSRHVFDFIAMLDTEAQDVLGYHDISQGKFTPGNKSAQEVAVMAESDRTRVRMASRWLTWALRRVMKQVLMNWVQWDDTETLVRIAGKDLVPDASTPDGMGIEPRYETFSGKTLKRKDENGKLTKDNVEFDLVIADTSMLPASQQERNNNVGMWLQYGVITPPDVLKYKLLDIPHASEIQADREREAIAQPPEMPQPENPDPQMMGAMSPVPEGLDPEQIAAAAQQVAEEMGMSPEDVLAQMGL